MGKSKENGRIAVIRRESMKMTIEYLPTGKKIETDTETLEGLAKALRDSAARKRILENRKKKKEVVSDLFQRK